MGDGPEHELLSKDGNARRRRSRWWSIEIPSTARRYHDRLGGEGQRDTDQKKSSRSQKQTEISIYVAVHWVFILILEMVRV